MGSPRKKEDLNAEPGLRDALADPVVQAVMRRDGVTQEALLRLIAAVRARLFPPNDGPPHEAADQEAPHQDAIVMPFPRRDPPAAAPSPELRPQDLRPRTRWPFCLAPAAQGPRTWPNAKA